MGHSMGENRFGGIAAAGGFATSESFPGMPHNFGQQYPYAMFESQLIAHPIKRDPPEVKFFTNTLQFNHAYWVTIDGLTLNGEESLVSAGTSLRVLRGYCFPSRQLKHQSNASACILCLILTARPRRTLWRRMLQARI